SDHTGTTVTFGPDPEIFQHSVTFSFESLGDRLRELAYLNKGINIKLIDERSSQEEVFHFEGGIAEYVAWLNSDDEVEHPPIYMTKVVENERVLDDETRIVEPVKVEVAIQYSKSEEERVRCYANNAYNPEGGTHLSGFRTAITRTLNAYGDKNDLFK